MQRSRSLAANAAARSMCRWFNVGGNFFSTVHQDHLHGSPPSQRANELKDRDRKEDSSVMNESGEKGRGLTGTVQ